MIPRILSGQISKLFQQFPIVTLIGPRQSGKTTLIKNQFSQLPYFNLEDPKVRELAQKDPLALFKKMPQGGILDEIQRVPELLSYLQGIVDEKNQPGQFILLGSHQFLLMKAVTQSLAGRTAITYLLPLSLQEILGQEIVKKEELNFEFFIHTGFYPRLYGNSPVDPLPLYSSYIETYVERDVRELIRLKDLSLFRKFLTLCAGRIGQILNKESLARDVGISSVSVEEWISVLEASFILFRLQPFHTNLGKRLLKSPKLYFYDVGLASYLLNIEHENQVFSHPLKGNLFENLVVVEAIKYRMNHGKKPNMHFYRDAIGNEIDLIFESGSNIFLMEIKSSSTFNYEYYKSIEFFKNNRKIQHADIVYGGNDTEERTGFHIWPWFKVHEVIQQWEDLSMT